MSRYKILVILSFLLAGSLQAQVAYDALRFSFYPEPGGTARTVGVGGATNAFGADFAVLSSNPAGLAAFRRSEFTFSPEIYSVGNKTLLDGNDFNVQQSESRSGLNINNLGLVIASQPMASKWKTINFGVGINRTASFTQTLFFEGASPGSITHRFIDKAQGLEPEDLDNFEEGLAFDVGAIYPDNNNPGSYFNDFGPTEEVFKSQVVRTQGSISEMVISLAGNYEEKLELGVTVGVPFLNFTENKTYQESDNGDNNPVFNELIYQEYVNISATGINLKLGMIYKPVHAIRIGAAFHTPTSFSVDDRYSTSMTYDYDFNGNFRYEQDSPEGSYEYRLRTPWRAIGSGGILFGKVGFLGAEVEYADYGAAAFNFNQAQNPDDQAYERELNREIADSYQSAFIVRLGGEIALDIFRIRAGYNLVTSPFADESFARPIYSAGFGVREQNFFLDLAYRRSFTIGDYTPYTSRPELQPTVDTETTIQHFLLTLGFKF